MMLEGKKLIVDDCEIESILNWHWGLESHSFEQEKLNGLENVFPFYFRLLWWDLNVKFRIAK